MKPAGNTASPSPSAPGRFRLFAFGRAVQPAVRRPGVALFMRPGARNRSGGTRFFDAAAPPPQQELQSATYAARRRQAEARRPCRSSATRKQQLAARHGRPKPGGGSSASGRKRLRARQCMQLRHQSRPESAPGSGALRCPMFEPHHLAHRRSLSLLQPGGTAARAVDRSVLLIGAPFGAPLFYGALTETVSSLKPPPRERSGGPGQRMRRAKPRRERPPPALCLRVGNVAAAVDRSALPSSRTARQQPAPDPDGPIRDGWRTPGGRGDAKGHRRSGGGHRGRALSVPRPCILPGPPELFHAPRPVESTRDPFAGDSVP